MTSPPLHGITVLDLTRHYAGGFITLWLAALGARVLKVESRLSPDETRRVTVDKEGRVVELSGFRIGFFHATNYSKLGVTLNLRHPQGQALARELVKVSDVVAENFSTGVMERFGLGYPALRQLRPDIILVSLSGFGRSGPYRGHQAFGHIASSFGGVDYLTGFPGEPPASVGSTLDGLTSLHGVYAVLAALHHRAATGQGQHIDLAMSEVQLSLLAEATLDYAMNQRARGPRGNRDEAMAPHNCYPCSGEGQWLALAVASDQEWARLCQLMGRPELAAAPRFADGLSRWQHQEELDGIIAAWAAGQDAGEAAARLQEAGVAATPVMGVPELVADHHLQERGAFLTMPGGGRELTFIRVPGDAGGGLGCHYAPAPGLGEHNAPVFQELLGLSSQEVAQLEAEQVIY